ncbi:MAG: carboxypeptidase regulatory-like domain-containing protein [Candidatus Brocadiales bacterium]
MNKKGGFTLIEIIVVIGIVAAIAGAMTPLTIKMIGARREQAARGELDTIKKAIIGEARATKHGEEFTFGFVGDIGNVPASLDRLKTIGTLPAFSFDTTKKMGAGWNGPYIMEKFGGDFKLDPWGTEYSYSTTPGTNTDLGVDYLATITSAGPDRTSGTSDDLSVQLLEPEVRSDMAGYVKDKSGNGVTGVAVTINYPSGGNLTTASDTTDDEGLYEFTDIPIGDRTVTIDPKLLYKPATAETLTSDRDDVIFQIENFSGNDIAISSITAEYTISPTAYYEEVLINSVTVFTYITTRPGSGTIVTFAPVTVSRSTVAKKPYLARVQANRVETPDIVIMRLAAGGSVTIELRNFRDVASGIANIVDMTGIPFKITFSDGSVVRFTPIKES